MEDLLQEVEKYRLRCFWLKIPMCLVSGGDWFFSLERKDPFKVRMIRFFFDLIRLFLIDLVRFNSSCL